MYYVYIMASQKNGTIYTGVTSNLLRRAHQHKSGTLDGFTKKYHTYLLVYFEPVEDINSAITREKRIKAWKRQWKIELIEKINPNWEDLYVSLLS